MKNIIGKFQKKGIRMIKRKSRKQTKLVEHLIESKEQAKMYLHLMFHDNGFQPDYINANGQAFDVFWEGFCRYEYGVELNCLTNKIKGTSIIISDTLFPWSETRDLFASMVEATYTLDNLPIPWPESDSCLKFWKVVFPDPAILDAIYPLYTGEVVVPGRPRFFEQLSIVAMHLCSMKYIADLISEGQSFTMVFPDFHHFKSLTDKSMQD